MAKQSALVSFLRMRCPACRDGFAFVNRSVFPLKQCVDLAEHCPGCGQKLVIQSNAGGGINYAMTMSLFFLNILWYWPLFGFTYKDNSFISFLISSIIVVVLVQPWLMRYSRIIFLYFIVKYKHQELKATISK